MKLQLRLIRLSFKLQGWLTPNRALQRAFKLFSEPRRLPIKPWEQVALRNANRRFLKNGLGYLHYAAEKPRARAVALHGWEGRGTHWFNIAEILTKSEVEVFAIEGAAHGKSPGVVSHPLLFKEALVQAQRELGEFDFVLGHSMGAGAMVMALNDGLVAQKAIFLAGPDTFTNVMWRFCENIDLPKNLWKKFGNLVGESSGIDEPMVDIQNLVTNLKIPALVIHDENDQLIPVSDGRKVAENWANSKTLFTSGLGHQRILRDQAVLTEIKNFLITN